MVIGQGSTTTVMSEEQVRAVLAEALPPLAFEGQRVLVIIPDATRTAPIPLIFRLLYDLLGARVARLDYLIALGTHPPMPEEAIARLVGVDATARAAHFPKSAIYNHRWDLPETLHTICVITEAETAQLTGGLLVAETPVTLNRMIFDYDRVLICGPVFPHEVAGFSGGAKYLFPGIAGAETVSYTHLDVYKRQLSRAFRRDDRAGGQ